jgi:hypothetical protein
MRRSGIRPGSGGEKCAFSVSNLARIFLARLIRLSPQFCPEHVPPFVKT